MDWERTGDRWNAVGADGFTAWEIVPAGGRWGIIVAHWGRPDWYADTVEDAKKLAEEIDARPPIPPEQWVIDVPED